MRTLKNGHHKHSKIIFPVIITVSIILGLLELSTFYSGVLNNEVNILLTIILLVLCLDNYLHFRHHKKNKQIYFILSLIFLILTISHTIRQIFGAIVCKLPTFLSVYAYEGFAIIFGLFMLYAFWINLREHRKVNYHSISVGIAGLIISVNHIIKIFIGVCV